MEHRIFNMAALLNTFGVPADGTTAEKLRLVNRLTYLSQSAGVPLAYRFRWNGQGPWCPQIQDDLREAVAGLRAGRIEAVRLNPDLMPRIARLLAAMILQPPDMPAEVWIDLLGALGYLRREGREETAAAARRIAALRPELADHLPAASRALQRNGLLDAVAA